MLQDRIAKYAKPILDVAKDPDCDTKEAYQMRFVYGHAGSCFHTARAYWILRNSAKYDEAAILARTLLERVTAAKAASENAGYACELIAADIGDRIHKLDQWNKLSGGSSGQLERSVERLQPQLKKILDLIASSEAPRISKFDIAVKADMEGHYRSAYFEMSSYSHGDYNASFKRLTEPHGVADFIALTAPLHTAHFLLHLTNPSISSEDCEKYGKLHKEATDVCFSDKAAQ